MGERASFPVARYLIPGVALCVTAAWFALQQWLSVQPWWPALPWFEIFSALSLFAFGVVFGLVYDDLTNRDSQLRKWLAACLAVAEVQFVPASEDRDGVSFNVPYFSIRFTKRVHAVQIEVTLISHLQFRPLRPQEIIFKLPAADYPEGETLRVPVAVFPRENGPHGSYWGDNPKKSVIGKTGNLIELRAVSSGGVVLQRYKVFISVGEHRDSTNDRYSFITEDRDIFGTKT